MDAGCHRGLSCYNQFTLILEKPRWTVLVCGDIFQTFLDLPYASEMETTGFSY